MGTERVVKLLRGHRVRIARALVRQTRALAPRYEQLDSAAQERSFITLLLATERLLERGDEAPLLDAASHIAEMRSAMGFRVDDFVEIWLGATGGLVAPLSEPAWSYRDPVPAGADGAAHLRDEDLLSSVIGIVAPSLGVSLSL